MEPKSGKAVTLVAPTEPVPVYGADVADPGQAAEARSQQMETGQGKYGQKPVAPYKPPASPEEKGTRTSWIEIELVGEDGAPVPGARYRVKLPDNTVTVGTLDGKGFARLAPIDPGTCEISFPDLDADAWRPA